MSLTIHTYVLAYMPKNLKDASRIKSKQNKGSYLQWIIIPTVLCVPKPRFLQLKPLLECFTPANNQRI